MESCQKSSVVYGSKSTRCPWFENVNFQRKFSYVLRFCALLMTSLILGAYRETKNRIVFVEFQSECYVKILSTGNDVYGSILTPLKINIAPKVKQKPEQARLTSSPGGLTTCGQETRQELIRR